MQFPIITYNNLDVIYDVMQMLARVRGSNVLSTMILVVALITYILTVFQSIPANNVRKPINWALFSVIAFTALYMPCINVVIEDKVLNTPPVKVDNVPFGVGFLASITSTLTEELARIFEREFVDVDETIHSYRKHGMMSASKAFIHLNKMKFTTARAESNFREFAVRCVAKDYRLGVRYTREQLSKSTDIWSLIKNNTSPLRHFEYRNSDNSVELLSCREGANGKLEHDLKEELKKTPTYYIWSILGVVSEGKFAQEKSISNAVVQKALSSISPSLDFLTDMSQDRGKILSQALMINLMMDLPKYQAESIGATDVAHSWAMTRSKMNQYNTGMIMGDMAATGLSTLYNLFQYIIYGSFYIIALLVFVPEMGKTILLRYASLMLWIATWPALYSLINYFMKMKLASTSVAKATFLDADGIMSSGWNLFNSTALLQHNQEQAAYAGIYLLSVPVIAVMLTRGAGAFVHLANHMTSVMQHSASQSGDEMTTGQYAVANTNFDNHSAHNVSANHFDTRAAYNAMGSDMQLRDGTRMMHTGDNEAVYNMTPAQSQMITQIGLNQMQSASLQEHASHAKQAAQTESMNYSQSLGNVSSKMISLAASGGVSSATDERYSASDSAQWSDSFSKIKSVQDDFRERFGVTDDQSAQFVGQLRAFLQYSNTIGSKSTEEGFKKYLGEAGVGATGELSTNFTSRSAGSQMYEHGKNLLESADVKKAFDDMERYASDDSFVVHNDRGDRLSDDLRASLDEHHVHTDNYQKSLQNMYAYQEAVTFSEQDSSNISQNLQQGFFNYVREQEGDLNAACEVFKDPTQSLGYAKDFIETQTESRKTQFAEAARVRVLNDIEELHHEIKTPSQAPIKSEHEFDRNWIMRAAHRDGVDVLNDIDPSIKDKVLQANIEIKDQAQARMAAINQQSEKFEAHVETRQTGNKWIRSVKNLFPWFREKPFEDGEKFNSE